MFHHCHGGSHAPDGQGSLSAEECDRVIRAVGVQRFLTPREWLERVQAGTLDPDHRCITFDDGLRSQFDVCLPVLEDHGLLAFWFVYSAPMAGQFPPLDLFRRFRLQCFSHVEEYYREFFRACEPVVGEVFERSEYREFLSRYQSLFPFYSVSDIQYRFLRDQVLGVEAYRDIVLALMRARGVSMEDLGQELWLTDDHLATLHRRGHVIGLHSYDHPTRLSAMTDVEQRDQYVRNYEHLARVCDTPVAMSHPCNSYGMDTLRLLTELGIVCGFRSNMAAPDGGFVNRSVLELAREDVANLTMLGGCGTW